MPQPSTKKKKKKKKKKKPQHYPCRSHIAASRPPSPHHGRHRHCPGPGPDPEDETCATSAPRSSASLWSYPPLPSSPWHAAALVAEDVWGWGWDGRQEALKQALEMCEKTTVWCSPGEPMASKGAGRREMRSRKGKNILWLSLSLSARGRDRGRAGSLGVGSQRKPLGGVSGILR